MEGELDDSDDQEEGNEHHPQWLDFDELAGPSSRSDSISRGWSEIRVVFRAATEATRPEINGPKWRKPLLHRKLLSGKLLDKIEVECHSKMVNMLDIVLSQVGCCAKYM